MQIEKIVLTKEGGGKGETTFLKEMLGERWSVVQLPLPHGSKARALPELRETYNGVSYEFVASKVFDDGTEPWGGQKKCLRMVFAAIAGEGLPLVLLQDELEKLADWCALPNSRKVVSRLELLQSPGEVHFELVGSETTDAGLVESYGAGLLDKQTGPRLPIGRAFHAMVELGGKLYVIGGKGGTAGRWKTATFLSSVLRLDPCNLAQGWVQVASMHEPRAYVAATVMNGQIYAVGGSAG
jgi:hypothetical protein